MKADPTGPKPVQGPPLPASLVGALPAEEIACRADLTKLGVSFEPRPPESGENGCAMPYPLAVAELGGGIAVEPPLIANCAVTRAAAEFMQSKGQAAAERHLGERIVSLANGSGYVCRPRRGTQKLSEHALGNAIDIMSFELSGEGNIVVGQEEGPDEAAFIQEVRKEACGPFTTVLGPGSDADHSDHLHLDLADRREGSTFCQ
ncbi:extensin family protein [Tianweitania sediminis]|uniref:Extensin family protein n=1 Tax=Tianweitania sediminis TaxID=1502156 RepID=A0A8J7RNY6_9HYPH|nr:extensin family protein [Tianweitania sediminis]MBP0439314.1 extensin family protein [Tianweitania sediminis]